MWQGLSFRGRILCFMDTTKLTLAEIGRLIKNTAGVDRELHDALRNDDRIGAREFFHVLSRRLECEVVEACRLRAMYEREEMLAARGVGPVAGLDEAGRGPLAGPVVAAAVVLPVERFIPGLNDSKKLSPARREQTAAEICNQAEAWAIAVASVTEIERYNILGATFLAMRRAIRLLSVPPRRLLVDGNLEIRGIHIPQSTLVDGDAKCASIAAASILAKVWRDRLTVRCHEAFPEYGFDRNKGYGTREHCEDIIRFGPTPIHRGQFIAGLISTRTPKIAIPAGFRLNG